MLTNDIVSFEQLDPDIELKLSVTVNNICHVEQLPPMILDFYSLWLNLPCYQ